MSYREIRNLTEHLKSLGFPRLISMENFNTPNFPLLMEILVWAAKMVDSNADISSVIDTQHDRVLLIRVASIFFYQKLGIRLNTARLYGADKSAIRELLKITMSLYQATETALLPPADNSDRELLENNLTLSVSVKELREARHLASGIVLDAAALHDSLHREIDGKMARQATINRAFDIDRLEATLLSALHALSASNEDIKEATEQMEKQEEEIAEKIQKKKDSLIRNCKRLEALNKIKPSWQSEFEEEERNLHAIWQKYVIKHRNLTYLEEQLEGLEKQHLEKIETLPHNGVMDAASVTDDVPSKKENHLDRSTAGSLKNAGRRIFGSMTGDNVNASDESTSTDSFLNDSGSDDEDSLILLSKENDAAFIQPTDMVTQTVVESLSKQALYSNAYSASNIPSHKRPSSARPKSAHIESRVNTLNNMTGSVKGSERVSPLSASEDNSEGF
ncbi:Clusterin-associated protein 1 [Halocaridina rubra]|uniref:Clusterin-associated protein 1 n=1 Tax=Halocaridina rubra TaxID=373956 RepID=A0AAN8X5X5_HALRR